MRQPPLARYTVYFDAPARCQPLLSRLRCYATPVYIDADAIRLLRYYFLPRRCCQRVDDMMLRHDHYLQFFLRHRYMPRSMSILRRHCRAVYMLPYARYTPRHAGVEVTCRLLPAPCHATLLCRRLLRV